MTYGESNGHLTDDVTWLRKVKLVTPIRSEPVQCLEYSWRSCAGRPDKVYHTLTVN